MERKMKVYHPEVLQSFPSFSEEFSQSVLHDGWADSYTSTEKLSNFVRSHRPQTKLFFSELSDQGQLHQFQNSHRRKHSDMVKENLQCRVMGERAVRKVQSIHCSHFLDLKFQLSLTYFSSGISHWPHSHSNSKSLSLFLLT